MTTTSETSMLTEVLKIEKENKYRDPWVYRFTNDREFDSTDKSDHGIYDGS